MAEYIKRADAMTICERYSEHCFESSDARGQDIADRILDEIAEMHIADVEEVKHAKWEIVKITGNGYGQIYYQHKNCPVNSTELYECAYERCPRCGAKMDGGNAE